MAQPHDPSQADRAAVAAMIDAVIVPPAEHLDRSHGELASGGMASVELAVDRTLGRRVALKLLHPHLQQVPAAVRSFLREAQITGQLDHPNIVPIHELAVDADGRLCFTMQLIEGRTLLELLDELRGDQQRTDARGLRISTTLEHDALLRMLDVFLKVLDAIAFAHARNVVHCDIKPENVMVGDFGQVYLMDWGIAKLMRPPAVAQHDGGVWVRESLVEVDARGVVGTPAYMSPEQARGARHEVDERSDIFALGALLFEILTGHPPYQGLDAHDELEQARACKAVLLPHLAITRELRRIVARAMDADPSRRYASVEQFRADLQGFMRGGDNFPRQRFAKGEWLIREGEHGGAAYILVAGRCEVTKLVQGRRESLSTLGPGDVFGETAILASSPRTASVQALTEVVAVVVTAEVLEREVDAMKPWMGSFIRSLARRFSDVTQRTGERKVDPAQIANLALMTLKTWGRRDKDQPPSMSVMQLCEAIARISGTSEDAVLKILRQYGQLEIALARDRVTLVDERGLAGELRRFVWP